MAYFSVDVERFPRTLPNFCSVSSAGALVEFMKTREEYIKKQEAYLRELLTSLPPTGSAKFDDQIMLAQEVTFELASDTYLLEEAHAHYAKLSGAYSPRDCKLVPEQPSDELPQPLLLADVESLTEAELKRYREANIGPRNYLRMMMQADHARLVAKERLIFVPRGSYLGTEEIQHLRGAWGVEFQMRLHLLVFEALQRRFSQLELDVVDATRALVKSLTTSSGSSAQRSSSTRSVVSAPQNPIQNTTEESQVKANEPGLVKDLQRIIDDLHGEILTQQMAGSSLTVIKATQERLAEYLQLYKAAVAQRDTANPPINLTYELSSIGPDFHTQSGTPGETSAPRSLEASPVGSVIGAQCGTSMLTTAMSTKPKLPPVEPGNLSQTADYTDLLPPAHATDVDRLRQMCVSNRMRSRYAGARYVLENDAPLWQAQRIFGILNKIRLDGPIVPPKRLHSVNPNVEPIRKVHVRPVHLDVEEWQLKLALLQCGFLDCVEQVWLSRPQISVEKNKDRIGYIYFTDTEAARRLVENYSGTGGRRLAQYGCLHFEYATKLIELLWDETGPR